MVRGTPCPVCGSTNTYATSTELVCRHGHRTPLSQLNGYDQDAAQHQGYPPNAGSNPMVDIYNNFGR